MMNSVRLEDAPCPLRCIDNDEIVLVGRDRLHDLPGKFTVVRCRGCGLMRTNPRPTPDTIGAYYPCDYAPHQANKAVAVKPLEGIKKWLAHVMGLNVKILPPVTPGRMLELGCASGAYMAQMREEGWAVTGIEFSEAAARLARDEGFDVQVASVESASAPDQPVDVIAAWMVLEHLHEPVNALAKLRTWVKPDGYLVATVPDTNSFEMTLFGERWYALHLPAHLYHFNCRSLAAVLRAAGWDLVNVRWQRNCYNLLRSGEYLARDKKWTRVERAVQWIRTSAAAGKMRVLLGWALGVTRQSGRMEIWARPMRHWPISER